MYSNRNKHSYEGRHAELYDIFYGDKPYQEEAGFIHRSIERYGDGKTKRLIELACGTGVHALELEKFGYKIVALDNSPGMLVRARSKATEASSSVDFRLLDMRDLPLDDALFDVAVCLFDSIGYVRTNEGLMKVLRGVHRSLRPGGLFIFEFWHAPAMLKYYDPVRVKRWNTPEGEILRISETTLYSAEQLAEVIYSIYDLSKDGTYSVFSESQFNRFFLVQEMMGWLDIVGFKPLKWCAGFSDEETISERTWHVVAVATRLKT